MFICSTQSSSIQKERESYSANKAHRLLYGLLLMMLIADIKVTTGQYQVTQYQTLHTSYRSLHQKRNYKTIFAKKNPNKPKPTELMTQKEDTFFLVTNKQWILREQLDILDVNVGDPCLNSLRGSLAALITMGVCQTKSWYLSKHNSYFSALLQVKGLHVSTLSFLPHFLL